MRRWFLLIVGNLLAILVLLFFFDAFGVLDTYSVVKDRLFTLVPNPTNPTIEELERELQLQNEERQQKILLMLEQREELLSKREEAVKMAEATLQQETEAVAKERENIIAQKEQLEIEKQEAESYNNKVVNLANRFYDMPPESASERILELSDDLLIIDVLSEMDQVAVTRGQQSVVPFLFSLMPKEDAARILRKSTISL